MNAMRGRPQSCEAPPARRSSWRVLLWCAAMAGCGTVPAEPSTRIGSFDFGYEISGDARARPLQAFDDGSARTYFQFGATQAVPVVLVGPGQRLLYPRSEGLFHVVDGVARHYTLVIGTARAQVVHRSLAADVRLQPAQPSASHRLRGDEGRATAAAGSHDPGARHAAAPMAPGAGDLESAPKPVGRTRNSSLHSYACPLQGDVLAWGDEAADELRVDFARGAARLTPPDAKSLAEAARRASPHSRVRVTALGDRLGDHELAAQRAQTLWRALVASGVAAQRIELMIAGPRPSAAGSAAATTSEAPGASTVRWQPAAGQGQESRLARGQPCPVPESHAPAHASSQHPTGRQLSPWTFETADGTVATALARWAARDGLDLVWEAPWAVPLTGPGSVEAEDFKSALTQVIQGLRLAGYPVRARIHSDRVVSVFANPVGQKESLP
jgi:hypothetical protein